MAKIKHVEQGWCVRIGRPPRNPPYFVLSENRDGPQVFDVRRDALAVLKSLTADVRKVSAVVRVEVRAV